MELNSSDIQVILSTSLKEKYESIIQISYLKPVNSLKLKDITLNNGKLNLMHFLKINL